MKDHTYFKNTRSQYKQKVRHDINIDSDVGARESVQKKWDELRKKLENMDFNFNDKEEIKKIPFINVLHRFLEYENVKELVTVELKYFAKSKSFIRAVKVNSDEIITTDRFLPRSDKMQSSNRFSPKDIEWLYLGFDRYVRDAKQCCFAEVRARPEDNVKYCKFKYCNGTHKVIDLTKGIQKELDAIHISKGKAVEEEVETFFLEFYLKILAEEIFLPVNSNDKDREYAPFHTMAKYFISLGYDGIIYKSTVSDVGKNIVMFNKESFLPEKILVD